MSNRFESLFAGSNRNTTTTPNSNMHQELQRQQQQIFADKSSRLLRHINQTQQLLNDVKVANRRFWPCYSPFLRLHFDNSKLQRSLSVDENMSELNYEEQHNQDANHCTSELKVLNLDFRMFSQPQSNLISNLEDNSIQNLLEEKLHHTHRYMEKLYLRIADKDSKVLVTGDLNAGKSTLVNALLKKSLLPIDQQPCTMLFCEVLDAAKNHGKEEIHALKKSVDYNIDDTDTFDIIEEKNLEQVIMDDYDMYSQIKIYTKDNRQHQDSLLHNGIVDVSLIDSPGLNRDSLKTTELFRRQEEIDVVVFVVNAENHFTLSGQEFLLNAGKEKAYVFIVVNRFDNIRNKDRCKKQILDQIQQISPHTFQDAQDLVHFVSANQFLEKSQEKYPAFENLEYSLRSFILEKRFKSKLAPAQVYLSNLLSDIRLISQTHVQIAQRNLTEILTDLEKIAPLYEATLRQRQETSDQLETLLDTTLKNIQDQNICRIDVTLEKLDEFSHDVQWPGFFFCWSYVLDVKDHLVNIVCEEIRSCETDAVKSTRTAIEKMLTLNPSPENPISSPQLRLKPISLDEIDVPISFSDLVDASEKLGIVGLSVSSLTIFGVRVFSYKHLLNSLVRDNDLIIKSSVIQKLLVVGGLCGLGYLVYNIRNYEKQLKQKVIQKVRSEFRQQTDLKVKIFDTLNHEQILQLQKLLQSTRLEILSNYDKIIQEQQYIQSSHLERKQLHGEAQSFFSDLLGKSEKLWHYVTSIRAEDFL